MSQTLHSIALKMLKHKCDLANVSATEAHATYRKIYAELQQAEKDYVNNNPNTYAMK